MTTPLRCPKGHSGPWRYAEDVVQYYDRVRVDEDARRVYVDFNFQDDSVVGTGRLLCNAADCMSLDEVPIPGEYVVDEPPYE